MAQQYQGGGKWEQVYEKPSSGGSRPNRPPTSNAGKVESYTPPPINNNSNRDTTATKDQAEKEFVEIEENILQGNVDVIPNPNLRAKQTVLMQYLGKNLTGLYFVENVTHTFNASSGYSQVLTVSRNGFGDSIKKGDGKAPIGQVTPTEGSLMDSSTTRPNPPKPIETNKGDEEIPINKWGTVTPSIGLNIRRDPSTKNPRITAMPKGSRVFCVSKKGDWYRVEWKGTKGWSNDPYIRLDK